MQHQSTKSNAAIQFWQRLPPIQKALAVGLLLVLSVIGTSPLWRANHVDYVSLLSGNRFVSEELQKMQFAFAADHLCDFQVRDEQIWVPRVKLAEYLQAVSAHGAMPRNLTPSSEQPPNLSPFLSRYQQNLQQQFQKKQLLREMLGRLPFVENAWVEFDVNNSSSPFEKRQSNCAVSIQPREQLILDGSQLETIRQMIQGSIAGMESNGIVIVDLAAGMAYDHQLLADCKTVGQSQVLDLQRRLQRLEKTIKTAVEKYNGLAVSVATDPNITDLASPDSPIVGFADHAPSTTNKSTMLPSQTAVPGSNGHAVVAQKATTQRTGNADSRKNESDQSQIVLESSHFRPRVTLHVPRALLAKTDVSTSSMDSSIETRGDLAVKFERLKEELVEKVRPLLPSESFDDSVHFPISVELEPETKNAPSTSWSSLLAWVMSRDGGMWLAVCSAISLGALLLLSFQSKSNDSRRRTTNANTLAIDGDLPVREQEVKRQIDDLLQNDPETAAHVIQQWIKKAA